MSATVFYSWQSDIRAAACRSMILDALEGAAAALAQDKTIAIEPVIDRDTQGVPGSPDIGLTILAKIDAADIFVADVTIINSGTSAKSTPNPNVLVELGYALKSLSWERIILVVNVAFGGPELLPFHLRQKRAVTYSSTEDAPERAPARRELQGKLEQAMRDILKLGPAHRPKVALDLDYEEKSRAQDIHHYELVAAIRNIGTKRFDDWEVEVEIPTPLLEPGMVYGSRVGDRSNQERTLFRALGRALNQPLRPGDQRNITIPYRVDNSILRRREELYHQLIQVRAYIDGELAGDASRSVSELQNF